MKNLILIGVSLSMLLLVGCVVPKQWAATGGSRADAVIRLSYSYGAFETPQVDDAQALALAEERCKTWGYHSAEAFGGLSKACIQPGSTGCNEWQVTKEFQCVGTGAETKVKPKPVKK